MYSTIYLFIIKNNQNHIMVSQNLKKLKAKETTTKTKTPFFNYVFNYFSIVIYSWKHHFPLQDVFCNSKMIFSTNFQNSQQCWVEPTT
jgi:hypothetical protein